MELRLIGVASFAAGNTSLRLTDCHFSKGNQLDTSPGHQLIRSTPRKALYLNLPNPSVATKR
jgi:hypothetical protein